MIYSIAGLNILASGSERKAIDFNKKDRAKPPARRGCSAYASESDTTNLSAADQYSIPACPGQVINSSTFSISKFKLFGSKCFQVFPAKIIFAGKRLGGNDVGHHFLIQRVYDGSVQSFGNCHNHEGLI